MTQEDKQLYSERCHVVVGFFIALVGTILFLIASAGGDYVASGSSVAIAGISMVITGTLIWLVGAKMLSRY